jgi:hypothetical protein
MARQDTKNPTEQPHIGIDKSLTRKLRRSVISAEAEDRRGDAAVAGGHAEAKSKGCIAGKETR